jgi:hypothetical protein
MIYSVIKIKFFKFNKIIKILNFIKLNKKYIKNGKKKMVKSNLSLLRKMLTAEVAKFKLVT